MSHAYFASPAVQPMPQRTAGTVSADASLTHVASGPEARRLVRRRLALSFANHVGAATFGLYLLLALVNKTWFPFEAMGKELVASFQQAKTLNDLRARAKTLNKARPFSARPPMPRREVEALLRDWQVQTRIVVPTVPASQHRFSVTPPSCDNYNYAHQTPADKYAFQNRFGFSVETPPAGSEIVQYVWGDQAQQARDTDARRCTDVWVLYKPDGNVLMFNISGSRSPTHGFSESYGWAMLYQDNEGGAPDLRPLSERPRTRSAPRRL